jgi:hypothetical protein
MIELIGGPMDGLVKHCTSDPGLYLRVPGRYQGFSSEDLMYFWSGRLTEDGRRAYVLAKHHPLRFS